MFCYIYRELQNMPRFTKLYFRYLKCTSPNTMTPCPHQSNSKIYTYKPISLRL